MRIARLDLLAFGPFTEKSLDFSGGAPGGLHLIFGRNAAGKSSALRAISDLLFGIRANSSDDHVHSYPNLRIRAALAGPDGQELVVQRLKKNKDSLRDASDAPLDEGVLKRLLGSVDRRLFECVFGLDHERLRDAGVALLEGRGDVGESLFDAGAGGQGVRRVLERLREEAERLFKPRGGKQEIVQLLESYKTARDRVRNATHAPEAYVEQQRELERTHAESEELSRELSRLRQERVQKDSLLQALKSIARRERLRAELLEIGPLPDLLPDFSARRERVQASLATRRANIGHAARDIERLKAKQGELQPPRALLAVSDAIAALGDAIGSTKKALVDLPLREAELAERRAEALAGERRLGLDSTRLTPEALVARRPVEARFRKLLAECAALAERRRGAKERLQQAELDWQTKKARLAALPVPSDVAALERAVQLARHFGDLEDKRAHARRKRAELDMLMRAELAMLAPFEGSLSTLCALRIPAEETIQRFHRAFTEREERARRVSEELERARERGEELVRELAAEEQAGPVPSEAELERARAARDEHFEELCRQWPEKPAKTLSLFEAARLREYRARVSAADALSDRLRREAARVAQNARRTAELLQRKDEQARLGEQLAALRAEREQLERDWAASWADAGIEPVRPEEMLKWLKRREHAVTLVVQDSALAEEDAELERAEGELRAALTAARPGVESSRLSVGVKRAEAALDEERKLGAERRSATTQIAELEVRREAAQRELERSEEEASARELELRRVIAELGFDASLAPEEVDARLSALGEFTRARDATRDLERRVNGMKRDIRAFEAEVRAIVEAHAPELAALPAERAAAELVQRVTRGQRDAEALEKNELELEQRSAELLEERALLEQAESEAKILLEMAGVGSLAELPALEARVRKARELRAELDGLEATLSATAGARGLDALIEEAKATDPARLSARLEELDERIAELEERHQDSIRSHQRIEQGLALFSDTSAVEAAQEERALASALITRADRWAKLKLAEILLSREIERYREQNQGPVLRRAAELFSRLTLEEYRGLRVGREERSLVAVRGSEGTDREVSVEGLNEAARYHLYLALRLASLERYIEHAEPLPLVLDDVLIHFDEEGARAALSVLGDLAARMQILLFTHHRHNVELAERAVSRERLFVHEL